MLTPPKTMFEIRVAVIGYVSVGKTTLINALLGNEYGEVSMRRTTAVVNSFRISSPTAEVDKEAKSESSQTEDDSEDDSIAVVTKRFTAKASLEETKADNALYRTRNVVTEKTFDIYLQEPLHEMRSDTKLVVVDIPGINEAGTGSKYKDYVNDQWHTFDIVVVVSDARQGMNSDEQHDLLELVKNNLTKTKHIPVIIVFNKVDDPYNKEQQALLEEARGAVSGLFGVSDRKQALTRLLNQEPSNENLDTNFFPAVVPIGAMHAFVYRCGSRLSFDEFCKMDSDFIDNLGKESYGRQWHRFNETKKLEKAFESVSDKDQCLDGIRASNFDAFVKTLVFTIGSKERQKSLICLQAEVVVKRLLGGSQDCNLGAELASAYSKLNAFGEPTNHLCSTFWLAFNRIKKQALDSFPKDFAPAHFSCPMRQLLNYQNVLKNLPFDDPEKVVKEAKDLVLLYAVTVVNDDKMKSLSKIDVLSVLGSMLLCSGETAFVLHFGQLKLWLESLYMSRGSAKCDKDKICHACSRPTSFYHAYNCERCSSCGKVFLDCDLTTCPNCGNRGLHYPLSFKTDGTGRKTATCNGQCNLTFYVFRHFSGIEMKIENSRLVPVDSQNYDNPSTIITPDSPEHPSHFGHIIWKCCQLINAANT